MNKDAIVILAGGLILGFAAGMIIGVSIGIDVCVDKAMSFLSSYNGDLQGLADAIKARI